MKGRRHLLDDGHELRLVLLLAPHERLELGDELLELHTAVLVDEEHHVLLLHLQP